MTFPQLLMVACGGFFGAIARYSVGKKLNGCSQIPMGTLTVNLLGAFLLGMLTGAKVDGMLLLLFGIGFMGAFTTFSTLKLEMLQMFRNGEKKKFLFYTLVTYGFGILLAYLGFLIGEKIWVGP
jgi:CrcB protein